MDAAGRTEAGRVYRAPCDGPISRRQIGSAADHSDNVRCRTVLSVINVLSRQSRSLPERDLADDICRHRRTTPFSFAYHPSPILLAG
jgi:hypothetical protein